MCMCTRLPARAILSTSAVSTDAVLTADSAHVVSPAAFSDAALSAAAYIPPASCRLCRRLSPTSWYTAGRYTAGTRPAGSSRSDRIGSARIGSALLGSFDLNRHGGRHISTWLSAGMGTDRRPPLHLFFSAQLALGSAQLGSARLGSAGAAWLARLVRHSAQDSEAPASRLGGAPRRRLLRAQHRQSAAQPRFSKNWAARWEGAALSLGDERCGAGEGGLPH